ncbi:MAG TPA: hypothetical protein VJR89_01730, partial [Polyangiales bacterium]|nr:hypothetical protein [Polyangiales bacterium]
MKRTLLLAGVGWSALVIGACSDTEAASGCTGEPGEICVVAGTGLAGWNGDGHPGTETDVYLPMEAAVGPDKRLYFTDWNNHRIRALDEA